MNDVSVCEEKKRAFWPLERLSLCTTAVLRLTKGPPFIPKKREEGENDEEEDEEAPTKHKLLN